jgi:hypothetical protein
VGDYNLSLEIKQTGVDTALADLDKLSKAGQAIVERYAKATNTSLDAAIAKYQALGDKGALEMLRLAVAAEKLSKAVDYTTRSMGLMQAKALEMDAAMKVTVPTVDYMSRGMALAQSQALSMDQAMTGATHAIEHGTKAHDPHIHGLSRIGTALATMVGHATGVPPVLERIGDALAITAFGHLATVGVLAGFAAIAFAYEKITEKAREAAEEIKKTEEAVAKAANAGKTDPIREAARRLQFGEPFDKEHNLVPLSEYAPGAFEGSLADLQGKLRALQEQFYRTANGFTQTQIQKQIIGVKQALAPLEKLQADIQRAGANVASQPSDNAGTLNGITIKALSPEATEKAFEKWASLQERQIKGLSLAGELSATRVGQLEQEAREWTTVANALGVANPRYERYLQLAHDADELAKKQDTLASTASRAMDAFSKDFKPPVVIRAGDAARMGLLDGLIPSPKDLADQLRYTIAIAVDDVRNSPAVRAMAAWEALGKRISEQMSAALGRGLALGFSKAFSGDGITGFFRGVTGTILSALGGMMEEIGAASIGFGTIMQGLRAALANPFTGGAAAVAYGVLLIGLGAALQAAGGRLGNAGGGGGGAATPSYSTAAPSYLTFGVQAQGTPTTSLGAPPVRPNVSFTLIGANDPKVQRDIADIVNRADSRGLIGNGR